MYTSSIERRENLTLLLHMLLLRELLLQVLTLLRELLLQVRALLLELLLRVRTLLLELLLRGRTLLLEVLVRTRRIESTLDIASAFLPLRARIREEGSFSSPLQDRFRSFSQFIYEPIESLILNILHTPRL